MKYTTDNEIEKLLKETSSAFSPSSEHFTKMIASLDMDTAHSTPKILSPLKKVQSPYASIFSQNFLKIATSAMVLFLGVIGVYEVTLKNSGLNREQTGTQVATTINTDGVVADDTYKNTTNTQNHDTLSKSMTQLASAPTVENVAMLAANQKTSKSVELVNTVSKEMVAEESATDNLFALNGI